MNSAHAKAKLKLAGWTVFSSLGFWSRLFCRPFLDAFNFVRVVGHGESLQRDPSRPLSPLDPETVAINPFDDTLDRLPVQQGNLDSVSWFGHRHTSRIQLARIITRSEE